MNRSDSTMRLLNADELVQVSGGTEKMADDAAIGAVLGGSVGFMVGGPGGAIVLGGLCAVGGAIVGAF